MFRMIYVCLIYCMFILHLDNLRRDATLMLDLSAIFDWYAIGYICILIVEAACVE